MEQKVSISLMFKGNSEEAIKFYTSVFKESEITHISYHDAEDNYDNKRVDFGKFKIGEQEILFMDSGVEDNFTFTPSISLYLNCYSEEEIDTLFKKLSQDGRILIPLDMYNFSRKYGWLEDKYGVSWQLNLE